MTRPVGNQSPFPLIDFATRSGSDIRGWESVTFPFDRLLTLAAQIPLGLGISHLSL